jgi:hypothetical protein
VNQEYIAARRQELANSLKYQPISTKFLNRANGTMDNLSKAVQYVWDRLIHAQDLGDKIKNNFYKAAAGEKVYGADDIKKAVADTNDLLKVAQAMQYVEGGREKMKELFEETGMNEIVKNSDYLNEMHSMFTKYAIDHGADAKLAIAYADAKIKAIGEAAKFAGILGIHPRYNRELVTTGDPLIDRAVTMSAFSGHDAYFHKAVAIRQAEQHVPQMQDSVSPSPRTPRRKPWNRRADRAGSASPGITDPKWYENPNPKPKSVSAQEMALQEKLLNPQKSKPAPPKKLGPDA